MNPSEMLRKAPVSGGDIGEMLRSWRGRRRVSQLDLALDAGVSARHLSFVENGRSSPSRDMVLRLSDGLDVPLRERNHLLLAAGYAPAYSEAPLDAPEMSSVRRAICKVLEGLEPYPALVVDRYWNLLDANESVSLLTNLVSPELLAPPVNVLRASLHPEGLAPHIINLGEWRSHLLGRLDRQVRLTGDRRLNDLLEELEDYPCSQPEPEVELPGSGDVFVPLRLRHEGRELSFFSTVSTFGTPLDVTVSELVVESFFPADDATRKVLHFGAK